MKSYIKALKNYATFNGRTRRKDYWIFSLINFLLMIGFSIGDYMLNSETLGVLGGMYFLAILRPSLSISARRLHDINLSGWWMLISLIPFAGIILLVLMFRDSQPGQNQYGANPKESAT
jgi:uncharacterized membrane protein YhaH (DUF805 family)